VVVLIGTWVAFNTEWGDVAIPAPLRGEAARNPFYAAERLVARLGATSERRETLGEPSTAAVVVLSTWGWDIDAARRVAFERWVEAGGRLVVDGALVSGSDAFERWSGVVRQREEEPSGAEEEPFSVPETADTCVELAEISYEGDLAEPTYYDACNFDPTTWLESLRPVLWALSTEEDLQAVRVAVGNGSVTVVNGVPFIYRELLEGEHAEVLAAATQLRRGDHVIFISEEDVASLPELVWRYGAPVVVVGLVALALALWRGARRFGPIVAPTPRARRSLGEQILGTGRFVVRASGGGALQAALARALHEAAARRIVGYEGLPLAERTAAVARFTGGDGAALAAALQAVSLPRLHELRTTLGVLESARRLLIAQETKVEAWKTNRN
jgi:hypothetical protein